MKKEEEVKEDGIEKLIDKAVITYKYIHKGYAQGFKKIECVRKRKHFPPSMTDESYFVPSAEENKTIDKTALMSHDPSKYDFPNGEITGNISKLAKARRPGADLTEIMEIQRELVEEANNSIIADAKQKIDAEAASKALERAKVSEIATGVINASKTE